MSNWFYYIYVGIALNTAIENQTVDTRLFQYRLDVVKIYVIRVCTLVSEKMSLR